MHDYTGYVVIRITDERSKFWTGHQWSLDPGRAMLFDAYHTAEIVARWKGATVHKMTTYELERKIKTKKGG